MCVCVCVCNQKNTINMFFIVKESIDHSRTWLSTTDLLVTLLNLTPVPLTKTIIIDWHLPLLPSLAQPWNGLPDQGPEKEHVFLARESQAANQQKRRHQIARLWAISDQPADRTMVPPPSPSQQTSSEFPEREQRLRTGAFLFLSLHTL